MNEQLKALCDELTDHIKQSYEDAVTLEQAEKLAAKFLRAQIEISGELARQDLDARMRKTGLKAIKAAVFYQEATKGDKKPSDSLLQSIVDSDPLVRETQDDFDRAEVSRDELQNYFSVFKDAHIFYRGVSRGKFE